ncbi:DNA primase [Verrucomicrobium sp. GAS474]|uniref:DNA primase n=1 Tax=Verrucomicrobium sp. GAS474 TaxID=1882831 RepID=UPI00087DE00C|nr:DNA primase [Verrucomicrobium sp. GAS474]SDU08760.1 DNA primase [Verrucomicrobium sp. GAS474]
MAFSPRSATPQGGDDFKEIVERVRQASDIVDVIGNYVPLKRAGQQFRGLSPFNREKTPSFYVHPDKQLFYCYSSQQGGDVFKFVSLYENLDFMGALRRLAERSGIEIPEKNQFKPGGGGSDRSTREQLLRLHEVVAAWWAELLHKDKAAEVARNYLKGRDFGSELAKRFQVGYAPDGWTTTLDWALKQGFTKEILELSGLVKVNEESGRRYDLFRGRLMFPICDETGRVVAFSGRLLDAEAKAAKYVNSPETPIFIKSKVLFGLDKTKQGIRDSGWALLCEGQIDLIRCYEHEIRNAVAPQGTAFTARHAALLKRFTDKVVICFDADRAGQKAAFGSAEILLETGIDVRIATMPAGDDPDSLLRRGGAAALRPILDSAPDYVHHTLTVACREQDVSTARGRGLVAERMAAVVAKIPSIIARERTALEVATRLGVTLAAFQQEIARAERAVKNAPRQPPSLLDGPQPIGGAPHHPEDEERDYNVDADHAAPEAPAPPYKGDPKVEGLLALALHHPELVPAIQRGLHPAALSFLEGGHLLQLLLILHGDGAWEDEADFMATLAEPERNAIARLLLEPPTFDSEVTPAQLCETVLAKIAREATDRRIRELEQEIKSGILSPEELLAKSREFMELKRGAR